MIDLPAELAALLDAWRACRASELAALVDEVSSYFTLVLPDLDGRTRTERHAAWLARARRPSLVDLPVLLDNVARGTTAQATAQLEVVAGWPPDPRTTQLARRMLDHPPFATSSGDQKVWRRLFDVVESHADPRAIPILAVARMRAVFDAGARGLAMRARAATVAATLEQIAVTPPAPAHVQLVARIERELASGRALRDAVRLEQDDDEQPSRLVLLDWLLERGYVPPA